MFPQLGLTVGAGGTDPGSIHIVGSNDVSAVRAGQAAVDIRYQDRLNRQVPVNVTDNPLTDLQIEPAQAVIHPGEPLVYQVTALRGGQRVVLGPENGVQLQSVDARRGPGGRRPGRVRRRTRAGPPWLPPSARTRPRPRST